MESLQIQTGGWTNTSELITSFHFPRDSRRPSCALLIQIIPSFSTETLSLKHSHTLKSKENFTMRSYSNRKMSDTAWKQNHRHPWGAWFLGRRASGRFPSKVTTSYHLSSPYYSSVRVGTNVLLKCGIDGPSQAERRFRRPPAPNPLHD